MFHCDAKIVDQESGREVKPGETGVLCLRSPHNFDGYLHDPARTEKVIEQDGWIYTGDLAVQDQDGLIFIKGRADNMFISGGENISPEEIEQALMKHPAIAGAICAGIPDPKWGQAPVALVVFHAGRSAVRKRNSKLFAGIIWPITRFPSTSGQVTELPLTGAGKLNRNAVVTMFSALAHK
jgi:fatty-acyl-CoA synthase